eukprot:5588308-Pyramimonas_sp.AAC.1
MCIRDRPSSWRNIHPANAQVIAAVEQRRRAPRDNAHANGRRGASWAIRPVSQGTQFTGKTTASPPECRLPRCQRDARRL